MVDCLVRMIDAKDAVGQSFNLIGEPMRSARGYFEALGAKLRVSSGNLHAFYPADAVKCLLKAHVLRRRGGGKGRNWVVLGRHMFEAIVV